MRHNKGQSTVEYIVIVTAILAVIIAFALSPNSPFQAQLNNVLNTATQSMGNAVSQL